MLDGFRSIISRVEKRFDEIKEKAPDVLSKSSNELVQNVKTGWADFSTSSKDTLERWVALPFSSMPPELYKDGVNLSAGFDLQHTYAVYLFGMHRNNANMSDRGRAAFRKLNASAVHCAAIEEQWQQMSKQHETLGEITDAVLAIQRRVTNLCDSIEKTEAMLDAELQKTIEAQITNFKKIEEKKLEDYQTTKEAELQETASKLQQQHAITTTEKRQKAISKAQTIEAAAAAEEERVRKSLEEKAQQDIQDYMIYGAFGANTKKQQQGDEQQASIEEKLANAAPALAADALDDFFNFGSPTPPPNASQARNTEVADADVEAAKESLKKLERKDTDEAEAKPRPVVLTTEESPI